MALPKNALQNAIQLTKIIKPNESNNAGIKDISQTNVSNSKLTFKNKKNFDATPIDDIELSINAMLSSNEKKIIIYLSTQINKKNDNVYTTNAISLSDLSITTSIPITTLKKSIQRIEKKGYIARVKFKSGRDGWTIYSFSDETYKQILELNKNQETTIDC